MMFYETKHPFTSDYFKIEKGENFTFPPHIHRHFELITLLGGEMTVTVGKDEYLLKKNDALLIFPNQIHSLCTKTQSSHILCIFAPERVKAFAEQVADKVPVSNRFSIPDFYTKQLELEKFNTISEKGLLYSICGEFCRSAKYRSSPAKPNDILNRIFRFVEENRSGKCSLTELAKATSYDYAYLSKFFKRSVGMSFCDYVNAYRLGDACYLLQNTRRPITDIALECGYASIRSFNRNFKANFKMTPNEYRKKGM